MRLDSSVFSLPRRGMFHFTRFLFIVSANRVNITADTNTAADTHVAISFRRAVPSAARSFIQGGTDGTVSPGGYGNWEQNMRKTDR